MRSYLHVCALATLAAGSLLMAACGGDVTTGGSTTGGGGSGASSSGTGSGGASTGDVGSAGGAGGGPVQCGGFLGLSCPVDQWCDFPDGTCGGDDSAGTCAPVPTTCTEDCPGACGCDGKFYCNACGAHAAGVDTDDLASCAAPAGDYTAEAIFGGLDHLIIHKADPARNICVTVHIAHPTGSAAGFSITLPPDYGAVTAYITDQASDCAQAGMPVAGKMVNALGGTGAVTFNTPPGKFFPCDISVHASISFPAGEPWVNPQEPLDADAVPVKNGCQ